MGTPARILIGWLLSLSLMSVTWAAMRINGNQMVEGGNSYNVDAAAIRTARGAAAGPVNRLVFNLGQGIAGQAQLDDGATATVNSIGMGLIFDVNNVAYENNCPIAITGDVNVSGSITSADIIYLVNFVFKGQAAPLPCEASGDVNLTGSVTSSDIIYLVNHTFKGEPPPGNVCFAIPGLWTCP